MFTKYSLETTPNLVLHVRDCFLPFHTILIRVGYNFDINKPIKCSDNKNQLSMSNQISVSNKTLLPWMCDLKDVDLKIIAKYVCDIKTDHQTHKPFSVSSNRSDKGDKIRSSKVSILIKLYNLSYFCDALSVMHFGHTEVGYIIMAIYSKLHLKVPVTFERYMSVNLIFILT